MGLGCVLLIVGSALLQIVGLGLVARDLWRVQHQAFGVPVWMRRVRVRVLRLLGRNPVTTVELSAALDASAAGGPIHSTIRKTAGPTTEERLAALEANLDHLDAETRGRFTDLRGRLDETNRRVKQLRQHVDELRHEQRQAQLEELREALPWQWIGTGLFAVGALLAMWASLAC